jgi:hypothetical protein
MSWLRKWFRRPVEVKLQILAIQGEEITEFSLDHWEGIARLFILVPGLRQSWERDLAGAIDGLSAVPPKPEFEGERIRLAQLVVDLKRNLDLPRLAVSHINTIRAQQAQDLAHREPNPQGISNIVQGA